MSRGLFRGFQRGLKRSLRHLGGSIFDPEGSRGTISFNVLDFGSNTSTLTSYLTASVAPAANHLILVGVIPSVATASPPTVTGNGITYDNIGTISSGNRRLSLFRGMNAAPIAEEILLDFGATSVASVSWFVIEVDGVDTSGVNGAGAIEGAAVTGLDAAGTATQLQTSLPSFEHANNVHFRCTGLSISSTIANDVDFAELTDDNEVGNNLTLNSEWATGQLDCTPTFLAAIAYGISIQIKAS